MNGAHLTGLALVAALVVAGFTLGGQDGPKIKNQKQVLVKDVRMEKGTTPGGVINVGSSTATAVPEGRQIATFGGG